MNINITTLCGIKFTRVSPHVLEHEVPAHLIEAALSRSSLRSDDPTQVLTVDFGKGIGHSKCVPTTDEDEIYFVRRGRRFGESRMVRNRSPEPTSLLTIVVNRVLGLVVTAYYGAAAPREPWDRSLPLAEKESAIQFWSTHALIE